MIRPSLLALATDSAAWSALDYPLSVQELTRLTWLQMRIAAAVHIAMDDTFDRSTAARFAFTKYLVLSHRLRESI